MRIGTAKRCTNTTLPIRLTGFGNPDRGYSGIHDDIWLRAMVIENEGRKLCFVSGDALGFEHDRIHDLSDLLLEKTGMSEQDILFNASHTHSAPQVMHTCAPTIGRHLKVYENWWYEQLVQVIEEANADLEEGELFWGAADCPGIGINRRRLSKGYYEFAPTEEGLRNDEAFVLKAVCAGRVKAILFKFTCHPSTVGFDQSSGDWPGAAVRLLEQHYPDAQAQFIQGCCGNIRVRTMKDGAFTGGTWEDVDRFGTILAETCSRILAQPMKKIGGAFASRKIFFDIPLQPKLTREAYLAAAQTGTSLEMWINAWYAEHYDELPEAKPYSLQRLDLGDELTFTALEGEVCVEYEYHMAKLLPHRRVITAGYSNGNPGYICTEAMYAYGGYEPEGSCVCYYNREGFEPSNEQLILAKAEALV